MRNIIFYSISIFLFSYNQNLIVVRIMYEKQNLSNGYQIKTRQYSNLNLREETRKNSDHIYEDRVHLLPTNNYENGNSSQKYSRYGNSQWSDKYAFNESDQQDNTYYGRSMHANRHYDNKGEYLQEMSTNGQIKRENARKRELQMRMNNINTINDKISNLLNLVKKERVDYSSKEKLPQRSPNIINRTPSPAIYRDKISSNFKQKQEQVQSKYCDEVQDSDYIKKRNKSIQRLRELSILQPNLANKKIKAPQTSNYNKKHENNEEDFTYNRRSNAKSYYSPLKNANDSRQKNSNNQTYNQRFYESSESNKSVGKITKYSPKIKQNANFPYYRNEQLFQNSNKYEEKPETPIKYQKNDNLRSTAYQRSNNIGRRQNNSLQQNSQSNYLPMTIVRNQNQVVQSPKEKYIHSYSGMKMIDDQIRRIKEKMGEPTSEKNQQKRQIKSSKRQENAELKNTKQVFPPSSANKFQLKIYPVNNEKPETIKIAEKLCYQIQIDSRMKKIKEDFLKVEKEQKWKELVDKLSKNGIRLTINDIKGLIVLPTETFNTRKIQEQLYSERLDALTKQFTQAQKFWEKHVIGCATLKTLRRQGFDARQLDENNKGYLSTDDISSFVNEYTSHSYKTNDIAIIFRRLQLYEGGNVVDKIEYSTFMQAFTK